MITIKIETENAAFEGNCGEETARILRKLADALAPCPGQFDTWAYNLMDSDGNTVGRAEATLEVAR